jgi:acetamidase/formamidase
MSAPLFPLALILAAAALSAETHQVVAEKYYRTFSRAHPVLKRIKPGDVVSTKTLDSGGQDFAGVHRHPEPGNPLTGPFYIEGAEPGDSIHVKLTRVRLNRNWGYSGYRLGLFSLDPGTIERLYSTHYKMDLVRKGTDSLVPWDIDLARGTVRLREPVSARTKMEFKAQPMLGCIGVAPQGDFAPTSAPAGNYGGNLDYNKVVEGATVILPVFHPGALLFLGDGHALQADGEPTGTGIETSMDIEFTVEVRKGSRVSIPRLENDRYIVSIGAQPEFASPLDRALQLATSDMAAWLERDYKLEPWAAHLMIGYQGSYDVVTVAGTMALKIPRSALPAK